MRRACPGSYSVYDAFAKLLFRKEDLIVSTYRYWLFVMGVKISYLGVMLHSSGFGGSLRFRSELQSPCTAWFFSGASK